MKTFILCLLVACAFAAPSTLPRSRRGHDKIVGGTEALRGEFPYQISFQDTRFGMQFHFCGGSIYKNSWIITAGHCVNGKDHVNPANLQIVAGEHNLAVVSGVEQAIDLKKIVSHDGFNMFQLHYDIALLELKSPLTFNTYVQPIALPNRLQQTTTPCTVTGWGTLSAGGETPDTLQKVDVPIVTDEFCRSVYGERKILDSMLCAGTAMGGKDSCQGDSGGPFACKNTDGSIYLGGIVSFGYGCAEPMTPGVYTEVSYFIDWIEDNSS